MKLFSTLQAKLAFVIAAVAISGAASSQTMQVNGAACTNASVTIANGIVNLVVPQTCGGTTATAPTITQSSPPSGLVGASYSYNFAATGSAPISWTVTSGTPPTGLSLSTAGLLNGTPSAAGSYSFTVQAANGTAPNATANVTIQIDPQTGPPVITSAAPPTTGAVGQSYSFQFTATGLQPITWAVATGTLPAGATLNSSGLLSGTLSAAGPYQFVVSATNQSGANSTSVTTNSPIYNVQVTTATAPVITAAAPPTTGTVGTAYAAYTFTATGSPTPVWSVASGALPAGLTLSSAGVLSGTPTSAGAATFTVKAANGNLPDATSASITITISGGTCTTGLSTDGFCMQDPSRTANKVTTATENGRLKGPPQAALPQLDAYSVDVATACNASQAAAGSAITNRWQHNIDFVSFRKGQTLEEYGMPPRHAITYKFVPATDPALPSTGAIQIEGASVYTGVATMSSITTSPCELDTAMLTTTDFSKRFCYSSIGSLRYEVTTGAATLGYCKLTPGTTYYFTMRFLDPATKQDSCTTGTCGGIFQLR